MLSGAVAKGERKRETMPPEYVRGLMSAKQLTPTEFAADVGVSVSTVYRWAESGIGILEWCGVLNLYDLPVTCVPPRSLSPAKMPARGVPARLKRSAS